MKYKGKEYPVYEVEIPGWGLRLVSVVSFEEALLTPEGNYTDEEARYIDEQIFFYVDDDDIERKDLGSYVKDFL